ncbi:Uncharacterised protein [Mycobacteroides abscessus subsp. abscessus]|nr:Uncharacterised protein [Mycobacteroides abscessus subsp. abscessus]
MPSICGPIMSAAPNSQRLPMPRAQYEQRPHEGRKVKMTESPSDSSSTPSPHSTTVPAPS